MSAAIFITQRITQAAPTNARLINTKRDKLIMIDNKNLADIEGITTLGSGVTQNKMIHHTIPPWLVVLRTTWISYCGTHVHTVPPSLRSTSEVRLPAQGMEGVEKMWTRTMGAGTACARAASMGSSARCMMRRGRFVRGRRRRPDRCKAGAYDPNLPAARAMCVRDVGETDETGAEMRRRPHLPSPHPTTSRSAFQKNKNQTGVPSVAATAPSSIPLSPQTAPLSARLEGEES
ncbi:hypothetical protein B0H19DRAFT_1066881 [Mycena capillaripes]|nr:hypothetical protein B0H19DRAFT_1066881 [Mycena capillaripes]